VTSSSKKSLVYKKIAQGRRLTIQEKRLLTNRKRDSQIFVINSTHPRHRVVERLRNNNKVKYICSICGLRPWWNNKPLILVLDHINGIYNDNRIQNLRFVCSNCDSQLPTYKSKNRRRR
jgi:hypothetical protein